MSETNSIQGLVRRLRDEADLCRNETATDVADLLDSAAQEIKRLTNGLELLGAGRQQDQVELKRCVSTLDAIARDWMKRDDMVIRSQQALLDVGAWIKDPVIRHLDVINIQHEETGRLKEWLVSDPIPHGWARVSEPVKVSSPNAEITGSSPVH